MYQSQNYPIQSHNYQPNHKQTLTQPPQNNIINSKDQAIQQLIYQNTILKKQLSQLINHQQTNINHQQTNINHTLLNNNHTQSNTNYTQQNNHKQSSTNNKQSHINNKQSNINNKQPTNNHTSNTLQSAITTIRPSLSHLHSYRNSLDNSIDFTYQSQPTHNAMLNNKNNTIDQIQNKQISITQIPIKHKRSYRDSVDMCQNVQSNYTLLVKQNHFQNHIFTPNNNILTNNNFINSNNNYQSPNIHFSQINTPNTPVFYTNQSNKLQFAQSLLNKENQGRCSYQIKRLDKGQNSMNEQQLYRQKMNKLKTRKSPQGRRLSEQKQYKQIELTPVNKIIGNNKNTNKLNEQNRIIQNRNQQLIREQQINPNIKKQILKIKNKKDQLIQAHQVLKSKLNNQMIKNNLNYSIQYKQIQHNKNNQSNTPQLISINNIINKSYNQIYNNTNKDLNHNNFKKFPKYTPKKFSIEKQYHNQLTTTQSNISTSIPTQSKQITQINKTPINKNNNFYNQSQQSHNKQQKKISIKQVKGRIYLDDQGQTGRTKRTLSRSKDNMGISKSGQIQNQMTLRNDRNGGRSQLSKRINTVQSQITYVDGDSYKKIGGYGNIINTDKVVMMRKNSNRVYLQQDELSTNNNKSKLKVQDNISSRQKKQLQRGVYRQRQKQIRGVNKVNNELSKQMNNNDNNNEQIVSIQQIHMLSIQNIDRTKILKNIDRNKNNNNTKNTNNKNNKNKNKQQQINLTKYNNQQKHNKNNNLNNLIYCNQDNNNKDIHY